MSNLEHDAPTRRAVLTGALYLASQPAVATVLPPLQTQRSQFVELEPAPSMRPLLLSDLRNRTRALLPPASGLLLLNIWATWCPTCRIELPMLAAQMTALSRLGVKIAAVSVDTEPATTVEAYVRTVGATALRIDYDPAGTILASERADGTGSPFHMWRMPITFVVDREAHVRGYIAGMIDWMAPESMAFLRAAAAS